MLKTVLLSILLFSSVSHAQFVTSTTSLTFDSVVSSVPLNQSKEIEFTNNGTTVSSIQLALTKRDPLTGPTTDYLVYLNRCINVRAKGKM